ncbi:MAG: sigma-70 family RNA polymerase sigma factor [Actinomycetia bacterium]|nr:sigma-70 family RNA polymerase sigma factor [Actinomycetes bacterium]
MGGELGRSPDAGVWSGDDDRDALVAAALGGDRRALDALMDGLLPIVTRLCRARIGHRPDAAITLDDVVQEVVLGVLRALPGYGAQASFVAWVHGVAKHKIVDAYRRAARNPARPTEDLPDAADQRPGPEALVLRAEQSARLCRLLDRLPERQRDILVLRVIEGLSSEQVAVAFGTTAGAVRVAQHRAMNSLREWTAAGW